MNTVCFYVITKYVKNQYIHNKIYMNDKLLKKITLF